VAARRTPTPPRVSLITTVKDAADHIGEFLASIAAQTRAPDEVVVVDGGSTDGTRELLGAARGIRVIDAPGANIAAGRNRAIAEAAYEVLAVSDADCVLDAAWLERILEPLEAGADVSMGASVPLTDGFLQECMACVNLPAPAELDEATFMPSARSVAFRRSAIERAGGYPEWLDVGEDMFVNHRWRELGLDLRLASGAVVRWRLRRGLADTWRQYYRYARGDAIAGMYPARHALRFIAYGGLAAAAVSHRRVPRALAVAAAAAYAATPLARSMRRFDDGGRRLAAAAAVPGLMAFIDAAKMAGYLAGRRERAKRAGRPPR
jgi:glycosyltransferase involved in cell wall biosynthesis